MIRRTADPSGSSRRIVTLLVAFSLLLAMGVGAVAAAEDAEAGESATNESFSETTEQMTVEVDEEVVGDDETVADEDDGSADDVVDELDIDVPEQPEFDDFEQPAIEFGL